MSVIEIRQSELLTDSDRTHIVFNVTASRIVDKTERKEAVNVTIPMKHHTLDELQECLNTSIAKLKEREGDYTLLSALINTLMHSLYSSDLYIDVNMLVKKEKQYEQ